MLTKLSWFIIMAVLCIALDRQQCNHIDDGEERLSFLHKDCAITNEVTPILSVARVDSDRDKNTCKQREKEMAHMRHGAIPL